MIVSLLVAAALQTVAACHFVAADRIYARDLAAVESAFGQLPADLEVGLSPIPGQQRVFRPEELTRIARNNHIEGTFMKPVCFSWDMAVPDRSALLQAMNETLVAHQASVELVDQSNNLLPRGKLSFPLSGLSGSSDGPVVWRGSMNYGNGRSLLTWARVRVSVNEKYVAADAVLHPGDEIRADQLKLVDYHGPIFRERHFLSLDEVVGMTSRSTVSSGSVLTDGMLRERKQVERGDLVQVTVLAERTRVEAQGIAEESGSCGSTIVVRNAKSGRTFRAKVQGKGKVLVVAQGLTGLVVDGETR